LGADNELTTAPPSGRRFRLSGDVQWLVTKPTSGLQRTDFQPLLSQYPYLKPPSGVALSMKLLVLVEPATQFPGADVFSTHRAGIRVLGVIAPLSVTLSVW
jgi:hypothetical protein